MSATRFALLENSLAKGNLFSKILSYPIIKECAAFLTITFHVELPLAVMFVYTLINITNNACV